MERELKKLLFDFAEDRKAKAKVNSVKVRQLTMEELEETMRVNQHLFEEMEEEQHRQPIPDPDRILEDTLTIILQNINISGTGYLCLSELLVFFAKLQNVQLQ